MGVLSKSRMFAITMKRGVDKIRRVLETFHNDRYGYNSWIEDISIGDLEMDDRELVIIGGTAKTGILHTCSVCFDCMEGADPTRITVKATYCDCSNDLPQKTVDAVFTALEGKSHRESRRYERRELWNKED